MKPISIWHMRQELNIYLLRQSSWIMVIRYEKKKKIITPSKYKMWKWFKNLKSIEQKCEMWLLIWAPIILNVDWISRQVWWIAVAVSKYHTIIHAMYVFFFLWNITTYQYMSVSRLFYALNQTTPFLHLCFSPHDIWAETSQTKFPSTFFHSLFLFSFCSLPKLKYYDLYT